MFETVAIVTLGCKTNQFESQLMEEHLRVAGYQVVPFEAGADLVIGNQPVHVQGIEYIQEVPVIYSTGCLLDGSTSSISKAAQGILVQAVFEFDERNADSLKLKIIPIIPSGNVSEGKNNYCPIECPSVSSAHKIMESIWYDSTNEAMEKTAFHILNQ